jgi:class 3 adenylate cyclase
MLYFAQMRPSIGEFGGTSVKFIGDDILVVFGALQAHEDEAERAVRCALGMRAASHLLSALRTSLAVDDGCRLLYYLTSGT